MIARKSLFYSFLFFCIVGMVMLSLLVIGDDGKPQRPPQRPVTIHQTATPTATPTVPPVPDPFVRSAPGETPLVYLAAHGNQQLPEVALTFDDGPNPGYTDAILGVLQQQHVQATFFMVGTWVQRYPDLAKAVVAGGHAIGDHSWAHPDLTKLSTDQVNWQLSTTRDTIQQVTGVRPDLFRPPYGAYTRRVLDIAYSLSLSSILWNVDPRDWSRPGTDTIVGRVITFAQNGSIILLHDGGGDRSQTVAALPTIIEQLAARGFKFVTIPQLLMHLTAPGKARLAGYALPADIGELTAILDGPDEYQLVWIEPPEAEIKGRAR